MSESICCNTYKGCIAAINEGQAEFHAYLISPDKDLYIHPFSKKFSNYPCDDGEDTAKQVFENCGDYGLPGNRHVMGFKVYAGIWHKIYTHSDVNKKDIVILFAEHLPLISSEDTFETIGAKIISLASQMASSSEFVGENKDNYSNIIENEFNIMELSPL